MTVPTDEATTHCSRRPLARSLRCRAARKANAKYQKGARNTKMGMTHEQFSFVFCID